VIIHVRYCWSGRYLIGRLPPSAVLPYLLLFHRMNVGNKMQIWQQTSGSNELVATFIYNEGFIGFETICVSMVL
jgi:hypothetical protein